MHRQKYKWLYRWQWLYLPPLYGVLALKFRYQDFFETFGGYVFDCSYNWGCFEYCFLTSNHHLVSAARTTDRSA